MRLSNSEAEPERPPAGVSHFTRRDRQLDPVTRLDVIEQANLPALLRPCAGAAWSCFISIVNPSPNEAAIFAIERPHPRLFTYYWIGLLAFPPLLPILILPAYFRYHTMRYKFTEEGISMSWGILFHRQIIVNYARIQDIHLQSNLVERWLGLGRILLQTASGGGAAEMTIEGLMEFEAVRDFLYHRMRGVKDSPSPASPSATLEAPGATHELAVALRETAAELRAVREELARRRQG